MSVESQKFADQLTWAICVGGGGGAFFSWWLGLKGKWVLLLMALGILAFYVCMHTLEISQRAKDREIEKQIEKEREEYRRKKQGR